MVDKSKYDFCGWATMNDIRCSDGRIIKRDAFLENDGQTVPIFWNHQHNDPSSVLGHALLKNHEKGVRAYGAFNDTEEGRRAKELVNHRDITSLSIFANELKHQGPNVVHGNIREVSLVPAGANSGAIIDLVIAHSEEAEGEANIYLGGELLIHSDEWNEEDALFHSEKEKEMAEEAKKPEGEGEETLQDVYNTLNDKQKTLVDVMVAMASEKGSNSEGGEEMKHNAFADEAERDDVLMHDGLNTILGKAKQYGSLKESFLAHAADYGIENIEFLNEDPHEINSTPVFINNQPSDWVKVVMAGVHNTPFAKVKMTFADITEDEARAKGYIKGKYKKEEVFKLLRRELGPTTIYKKQKFDRDDLIDADFNVVPWIKAEMELKLDEEKARAYIFGDGRSAADEDKIKEDCIIPVIKDEDLFTIKYVVTPSQDETVEHALINGAVLAQDDYQGSGNIIGFFEQKQVSRMMLIEDKFGHRLYKDINDLAAAMGVSRIVKVPAAVVPSDIYGVLVDLSDYQVGMKDKGKKQFFDDFDIDYNQQKYLVETRQSGGLTRPYSAVVLKKNA